MISNEL